MNEQVSSPQSSGENDTKGAMRFDAQRKSMSVAYLLWLFLGIVAAHRFYLGETTTGGILFALWAGGLVTMLLGVSLGLIFVLAASLWALSLIHI